LKLKVERDLEAGSAHTEKVRDQRAMELWRSREAEKQARKQEIKAKEREIRKLEQLESILSQ
jgi:hypothetical protein